MFEAVLWVFVGSLLVTAGYLIGVKNTNDAWREETNRVMREAVSTLDRDRKVDLPSCTKCGHSRMHHRHSVHDGILSHPCRIEGCGCVLTLMESIDARTWA